MSKMVQMELKALGSKGDQTLILTPRGINPANGVATLSEVGSVPALEKRVTISVSQPSRNRKNFKVFVKLQNPTSCVESGNCDPSVKRQSFSDVSFTFTQYSTTEERALIRTELAALLKDPLLIDAVDNLNPAY